jgi:hypothetical protein
MDAIVGVKEVNRLDHLPELFSGYDLNVPCTVSPGRADDPAHTTVYVIGLTR